MTPDHARTGSWELKKDIMDESVQKSCWGLTAKAVIGFGCIILLAWLVSGADKVAVLAAG